MTDEFKQTLLQYLIGKIPNEIGENKILAPKVEEISNSIDAFARQNYPELSERWNPQKIFTRGDYIILWCSDYDYSSNTTWKKSFVIALDKNYNPIKFIDKFESGTPLNPLSQINKNDDGTGNIYGVDIVFKDNLIDVDRCRVVIINDFTLTNFNIKLLNSYNIPQYDNQLLTILQFIKCPAEAKYFMIYRYTTGQNPDYSDNNKGGGLEFVNNVGSENEWNFYPYTGSRNIRWLGFEQGFPIWGDNGLEFKIYTDYEVSEYNGNTVSVLLLKSLVDDENKSCIDDITTNLPNECKNVGQITGCVSNNTSLLVETSTTYSELSETKYVIEYKISDLSSKIWYSKDDYIDEDIDNGYIASHDTITLFTINNMFCFLRQYKYYKSIHDDDWTNITYEYYDNDLYLNQIYNEKLTEFFIKDFEQQQDTNFNLLAFSVFDLYNSNLIFKNNILKLTQVYNFSNYNGEPYLNTNSLIPNSAELYSNNSLVFARNLYNKSLNGNTTVATVEVPNNYLNNIDITSKNLLSETNLTMIEDTNVTQKNIYETLFINFINTLLIADRNNATQVLNQQASSYLNTQINDDEGYSKAQIYPKVVITYEDNSTKEVSYEYQNIQDTSVNIVFGIYADNLMQSAQIISNDKTTVYQTIDLSSLEQGKYYTINQNLEIL